MSAFANIPGGGTGTGANVTVVNNGNGTVTMSNGIVSILCSTSGASITQINYTYNNGTGTTTTQLLSGGTDGGMLYWETGGFSSGSFTYSLAVDPKTNGGNYAELDLLSTSASSGTLDIHFSMLRGSPGFYVTPIWSHGTADAAMGLGETRTNIYAGSIFNWMCVDGARNRLMNVKGTTALGVNGAPKEVSLWTSGIYNGQYEDKYCYSADFGTQRVWGWASVSSASQGVTGKNVGLWDVSASAEYYNGGPMKRELMCHMGTTILNMFNGGHYGGGADGSFAAGEVWSKVYGPYFVYCNNTSSTTTDPVQVSSTLYADAKAQATAEASAWPYSWFSNSNYTPASGRGTVTGQIAISDSGNPNASPANLWVGVIQQPSTTDGIYDFQEWMKPYQFWVKTDANGNFSIPNVIAGTNYTLYAFGPGANDTFLSQTQTGGALPLNCDLPATPFAVSVTGGQTTSLGTVTWTPTRVGPTVFEIGYPDRTSGKFRHGDDYWTGDIGASASAPSPVWGKFLEYPFDFPNGVNYTVGTSQWPTGWNFAQPIVVDSAGNDDASSSTISFNLASAPGSGAKGSLYLALCSDYEGPMIVTVNGTNLGSATGVTATPSSNSSTGYFPSYSNYQSDTTIRQGLHGVFSDERLTFPATLLKQGTNTINIQMRKGGYFADHAMYDYVRLELTGYVPPAPSNVLAFAGNNTALVSWPVTPGATSYNVLRATTSSGSFTQIASNVIGPVCGSGPANATFVDTTATNGSTYSYEVQSVNPTGTSAASTASTAVAPSSGISSAAPAAPSGLTVTPGNGQAALSWTASTGANLYTVQRSTLVANGGGSYNTLGTTTLSNSVTGTTFTDTTPTNGSIYSYTVSATSAAGTGSLTTGVSTTPTAPAPTAAPTSVTYQGAPEQITLSWSAVAGATGYLISEGTSASGTFTFVASTTQLTYTIGSLADDTTYYFNIAAVNSGGASATTQIVTLTPPAAPTNVAALTGNTQVTLTWTASNDATSYTIERGTVSGGPYTTVGTSLGTAYTDNGLTNGTPYYYVIAASNANGTGPLSTEISATPVSTVPVAPTGVIVAAGYRQAIVSWTASSGATSYTVLRGSAAGGPYTAVATGVTSATYTDPNLTPGTTYYYVVQATNASGTGAYSVQVTGTTTTTPPNLVWTGTLSGTWDSATANWTSNGTPAIYNDSNFDAVTFDDTASTSTVTVSGTVTPYGVTFSNSKLGYTINGGVITGTETLVQNGTGTVVINNANTLTGNFAITGGTLAFGATGTTGGTIGTATIQLNQGAGVQLISSGHNFVSNAIQVADGASVSLSSTSASNGYGGAISGPTDATLTLSGALSLSSTGTAQLGNFNGMVVIPSGSQVRFSSTSGANGNGGSATSFQVNGTMYTRNSSGSGGVVLGSVSGSGLLSGQSNSGNGTSTVAYIIGAENLNSTFTGTITDGSAGTVSITKTGTGTLTLTGSNTYSAGTKITGGALLINGSLSTGSVTVSSGAALGGAGKIGGVSVVSTGASLLPGNGGTGTLTFAAGLQLSQGSTLSYGLGTAGASSVAHISSGTYTAPTGGTATITISALTGFGGGTYPLLTGATGISSSSYTLGTTPTGYACALSASSGTLSLTVTAPPAAPASLSATLSGSSVGLSWPTSASATGYNVKVSTTSGGPYTTIGTAATGTYTDANVASGTYYFVVTATNTAGESGNSPEATVSTATAFQQWLSTNGLPTTTSPSATPDNDQTSLLMKYATGLTPGSPSAAGPAAISSSGDHLVLQFDRLSPPPVNYLVEWSTDLVNWNSLATLASGATNWTGSATVAESGTSPVLVSVTDTASLANGTTPRFLRMRVTTSTDTLEPPTIPQGDVPISFTGSTTNATSLMLDNAPVSRNAITAVATSSLTVVNAGSWATTGAPYALRLLSGTGAGETYVITAQSGNVLTLSTQGVDLTQVVAVGDLYEILPLETLGLLYGTTSTALQTGGSATAADNVLFWNGSTWLTYFNNGSGWMRSGSLLSQNNALIPAGAGYMVQRRGASVLKYEIIGRVPEVALSQFSTSGGLAFLGATYPLSSTLGATNFVNTPTWLTGSSATSADNVLIWNGSTWLTFYLNGTTWYRSGNLLSQGSFALPVGTPLMIQRRSTPSAFNAFITQPLPYSPFTP